MNFKCSIFAHCCLYGGNIIQSLITYQCHIFTTQSLLIVLFEWTVLPRRNMFIWWMRLMFSARVWWKERKIWVSPTHWWHQRPESVPTCASPIRTQSRKEIQEGTPWCSISKGLEGGNSKFPSHFLGTVIKERSWRNGTTSESQYYAWKCKSPKKMM